MKVLITGGKTATAFKLLKAFDEQYQVVLADYGDVPSMASAHYQLISLGQFNPDTIAHDLLNCCLDNDISIFLPLHEQTISSLAKAQILFEEFNVDLILPSMEWLTSIAPRKSMEKKNWVVFFNGRILHANPTHPQLLDLGNSEQLNGAFYFNEENGKLVLSLIEV